GLRVVDGSIMPVVPSVALNPTIIMVAERTARAVYAGEPGVARPGAAASATAEAPEVAASADAAAVSARAVAFRHVRRVAGHDRCDGRRSTDRRRPSAPLQRTVP